MTIRVLSLVCLLIGTPLMLIGQTAQATAVEPIAAILDAFRSHQLVALGEGAHNNEQAHAFRLALVRDPRFAATVNDIVVEFGNSRYQAVMDRLVAGETIPVTELRRVWQDTTQAQGVWDVPIYEGFFRAVRSVNASVPPERQLRVLLGDPPFDWDAVHSREDMGTQIRATGGPAGRDRFAAELIQREVLEKRRRALLIFGDGHFMRVPVDPFPTIMTLLSAPNQVFSIWTHSYGDLTALQPDVATWRVPGLATVKGTTLGAALFSFYRPFPHREDPRMEDQFDAVLYLGPPSQFTFAKVAPALCGDASYMEMRLSRMAFAPNPPGRPSPGDALKDYCASVAAR